MITRKLENHMRFDSTCTNSSTGSEFTVHNSYKGDSKVGDDSTHNNNEKQQEKNNVTFGNVHIRQYNVVFDGAMSSKSRPFPLTLGTQIVGKDTIFSLDDYELSKSYHLSPSFVQHRKRHQESRSGSSGPSTLPRRFSTKERVQKLMEMGYTKEKLQVIERLRQIQTSNANHSLKNTRIVTSRTLPQKR